MQTGQAKCMGGLPLLPLHSLNTGANNLGYIGPFKHCKGKYCSQKS